MSEEDERHTSWSEIEAVVDDRGYRQGFVEVYLEFKGAVLDDVPLNAKGNPAIVTQSSFARHFGIAISTFNDWLGQFGDGTEGLSAAARNKSHGNRDESTKKTTPKEKLALQDHARRSRPEAIEEFADKYAVHKSDFELADITMDMLLQWPDGPEKVKEAKRYLTFTEERIEALLQYHERLLVLVSNHEAEDAA